MLRLIVLAVLSMAMFVAAASAAEAKVFRGKTTQGRAASVVIGSDGLLRAARVNWRGRCRFGRVGEKTIFTRPHDASTPDAFSDAGSYRRRDDGYRLRLDVSVQGTRIADARGGALARHVPGQGARDPPRPLRRHLPHGPPALHRPPGLSTAM